MAEYIERETLSQAILDLPPKMDEQGYGWLGRRGVWQMVNDFPAADVRPVVRGKWKVSVHKTYYDVSCSVCGINSFFQVDEKDSVSYANFCPNCGADMREES